MLSGSGEVAAIGPVILTTRRFHRRLRPCRTQLCRTFCLPLTLTDSELRNRPRRHPGVPAAAPELPEQRAKSRYVAEPKAVARLKAAVEMRRAAQAKAIS